MMTKIGIISGDILAIFDKVRGPLILKEIELHLDEQKDDILMSLGWLVREGFVRIEFINDEKFYVRIDKTSSV